VAVAQLSGEQVDRQELAAITTFAILHPVFYHQRRARQALVNPVELLDGTWVEDSGLTIHTEDSFQRPHARKLAQPGHSQPGCHWPRQELHRQSAPSISFHRAMYLACLGPCRDGLVLLPGGAHAGLIALSFVCVAP